MKMIREAVEKVVVELGLPAVSFAVEHPRDERMGDYSTNVAMVMYTNLKFSNSQIEYKSPRELAEEIVIKLKVESGKLGNMVERIEVAGAGFINFYLKKEYLLAQTEEAIKEDFGKSGSGEGKLAIVEYSSPNIAKPFTIGHLRSTVIGDAVANLLEFTGWKVLRDNHLGDWGTQFGKQICAIKHWGDLQKIEQSENPVKELVALYVKFHEEAEKDPKLEDEAREWFKKLENGDKEARELWQKCIDYSWVEFKRIYDMLGIKHSEEFNGGRGLGESFFEDKMGEIIEILTTNKMLKEGKEGAKLVFFPDDKYSPAMILKKDGATLYHTRDLATDKYRLDKYKPDLIVNEVGAEQQLYFQQLYEMEKILGWYSEGQRVHVMHGMYRFAEGKMSTRKGNVIWLEEVLKEAIKRAASIRMSKLTLPTNEVAQSISDEDTVASGSGHKPGLIEAIDTTRTSLNAAVGIGALKWNDLKGEARRDIVFDWEQVLSMQGNSGPFVQYAYARACSIMKRANFQLIFKDQNYQLKEEEMALMRWIYRYGEVVEVAARELAPHLVATYIYELSARFNTFYQACRVVDPPPSSDSGEAGGKVNELRYLLTQAVANVIKSGLGLLGIESPEEM